MHGEAAAVPAPLEPDPAALPVHKLLYDGKAHPATLDLVARLEGPLVVMFS